MSGHMNPKRILSLDALRIVAAFSIVMQHVGGQLLPMSFPSAEWEIRNLYIAVAQWGVPVFFMISGALFLSSDKPLEVRRLFGKNLLRVIYAFFFWAVIYTVVTEGFGQGLKIAFISVLKGPPHFWFLRMILGVYLVLPVLKGIATQERKFSYLVGLAIITTFVIPSIFSHLTLFNPLRAEVLADCYDGFGLPSLYFITYFMIGHWLYTHEISSRMRNLIYLLAALSIVGGILGTRWLSYRLGYSNGFFYDDMHPFIVIQGIAVFVFFKERFRSLSPKWRPVVIKFSNYSFGIYLVHPLWMYVCTNYIGLSSSTFPAVWFVPVYIVLIYILSYLLVKLVSMIPFIRKFVM